MLLSSDALFLERLPCRDDTNGAAASAAGDADAGAGDAGGCGDAIFCFLDPGVDTAADVAASGADAGADAADTGADVAGGCGNTADANGAFFCFLDAADIDAGGGIDADTGTVFY